LIFLQVFLKQHSLHLGCLDDRIWKCMKNCDVNAVDRWDFYNNGAFYHGAKELPAAGPPFGESDVIGCGVNFVTNSVFFTKNGVFMGPISTGKKLVSISSEALCALNFHLINDYRSKMINVVIICLSTRRK
uniref:B30.2/SPRY domain-containing protein n=1 Tax=Echinostoma caproni TaxID=27848 RepID=A0A183AKK8_9TREM